MQKSKIELQVKHIKIEDSKSTLCIHKGINPPGTGSCTELQRKSTEIKHLYRGSFAIGLEVSDDWDHVDAGVG